MSLASELPNDHYHGASMDRNVDINRRGNETILPTSHIFHPSSAKSMWRRMSLVSKLPNDHVASVDSNAVDRYGYEETTLAPSSHGSHPSSVKSSIRRRMSPGTKSVSNDCISPTPATPLSLAHGTASPRTPRNRRLLSLIIPSSDKTKQSSNHAADGLRSTIHNDCTSPLNLQESNRSFAGTVISMKKKTKGFGKNLTSKFLRSIEAHDPDDSPGTFGHDSDKNSSASSCFKGSKYSLDCNSRSSGNSDNQDHGDEDISIFSVETSIRDDLEDPEMLTPRSACKKRGCKKKLSSKSSRTADDNVDVGSNKGSKSGKKSTKSSRKKKSINDHASGEEIENEELNEVKTKHRGRNKYKIQSINPTGDMSQKTEEPAISAHLHRSEDLQRGSQHSRSSMSESPTAKKASKRMDKGSSHHSRSSRSGSVSKKSAKKMERRASHDSRVSRSESIGKKSAKKEERRASMKAIKRMDSMLDQLEKYENNLETEQMVLHKTIEAMALEKEYTEQRNRELELQLEDMKEKAETDVGMFVVDAESTKCQSAEEIHHLQIENDILKRRLQRHEISLLKMNSACSMRNLGASTTESSGEETSEDSTEVVQKDEEMARLNADLCALRDKLREKTEDYDEQSAKLEHVKHELAMLKYNMEHIGSFRYHNMYQTIKEKERMKMQPAEVALSDFFDAY